MDWYTNVYQGSFQKIQHVKSKSVALPVEAGTKLVRARNDEYLFDQDTYQTSVGCLIYLSTKKKELTLPMLSEMLQKIH